MALEAVRSASSDFLVAFLKAFKAASTLAVANVEEAFFKASEAVPKVSNNALGEASFAAATKLPNATNNVNRNNVRISPEV